MRCIYQPIYHAHISQKFDILEDFVFQSLTEIQSLEIPPIPGIPSQNQQIESSTTDTDESGTSEEGKRIDLQLEKVMENFEELSIQVDGFTGSNLSDKCEYLERELSDKKRKLNEIKLDAKGSRKKKCQACITQVDDLMNRIDKNSFKPFEDMM